MEVSTKQIFISFSSQESNEATSVCKLLERNGYSCFISLRDLIAGEEYAAQLVDNIAGCQAVVLLLSNASNQSPHVLREVEYAVSNRIPILVYTLEECQLSKSMSYYLTTHQWIPNVQDRDQRLLEGVRHILDSKDNITQDYIPAKNHTASATNQLSSINKRNILPFVGLFVAVLIFVLVIMVVMVIRRPAAPIPNPSDSSLSDSEDSTDNDYAQTTEAAQYALGDTITLGCYNDEPIEWRVIKIYDDNTLLLISQNILSMKTYDAAECGTYNSYEGVDYWSSDNYIIQDDTLTALVRGNNDWRRSNIRTWLNSSSEVVTYEDQAPTRGAVGVNYYSNEPGFLYSFTEEEQNALVPVTHSYPANSLYLADGIETLETSDLVFLLSSDELELLRIAGISIYAKPTEACMANDLNVEGYSSFLSNYQIEEYYWWLRDNPGEAVNRAFAVTTPLEEDLEIYAYSVGVYTYGIRPAICVDLTKLSSFH